MTSAQLVTLLLSRERLLVSANLFLSHAIVNLRWQGTKSDQGTHCVADHVVVPPLLDRAMQTTHTRGQGSTS